MWWPDFNIRFFKKGTVTWSDKIHIKPSIKGELINLPEEEGFALIHYHYQSITQYIQRLDRYTTIQAKGLLDEGYKFIWKDLMIKPFNEFLGRYFANSGYKDGLHGLVLALLQAFSFLVMYLKVWEEGSFNEQDISLTDVKKITKESSSDLKYWFHLCLLPKNPIRKVIQKVKYKIYG